MLYPIPFNEAGIESAKTLKVITNPKEELTSIYSNRNHSQLANLKDYGIYRIRGCQYNFKTYLKRYVYKQYDMWREAYAPSRTLLRKSTYGKIDKIVEIGGLK